MPEVTLRDLRFWCGRTGSEVQIDSIGRIITSGPDHEGKAPHSIRSLTNTVLADMVEAETSKERLRRLSGLMDYLADELKKEGITCDVLIADSSKPGNDNDNIVIRLAPQTG